VDGCRLGRGQRPADVQHEAGAFPVTGGSGRRPSRTARRPTEQEAGHGRAAQQLDITLRTGR
jgi:hypothetical protein